MNREEAAKIDFGEGSKIVALDFDGCIAEYRGYTGEGDFGDPLPGVADAVRTLRELGCLVVVWTSRPDTWNVKDYLAKHSIEVDGINENVEGVNFDTSGKIYAHVYVDDRGYHFTGVWTPEKIAEIVGFLPDYKRGVEDELLLIEGYDSEEHYLEIQRAIHKLRNEKVAKYGEKAYSIVPGWSYNYFMRFSDIRRKFLRFEEAAEKLMKGVAPDIEQCIEDANDLANYSIMMCQLAELHREHDNDEE